MDYQLLYKLIVIFFYSLVATSMAINYIRKKAEKYGYFVIDKYKSDKRKIPTFGGVAIFIGVVISLALTQIISHLDTSKLFVFYFVVIIYAMYGMLDDLFEFKRRYDKIIALLVLSLPIGSLVIDTSLFGFELNGWYTLLLAPIYVMVVANLINVYSGFNGLASGLSLILLITVGIKSYMLYGLENLAFLLPILGSLVIFFPFNFYPAKIVEGNVGAFMVGSALGAFLIINKLELFGAFILIPHIINFILDTYILAIKKIPDVKYGSVRPDGTVIAPLSVRFKSLKFILTYYFRLREYQAVLMLYSFTIIFCVLGVWLL